MLKKIALAIAFIGIGSALLLSYDVLRPAQIIDPDALLAIPAGRAKPVSEIANTDFTRVCILQPYQNRVQAEIGDLDLARVNDHLSAIEYAGDEGHWALILIADAAVDMVVFNRFSGLDLIADHELQSTDASKLLPAGFMPRNCAAGNRAALSKIRIRDRFYIVLGETI